MLRQIIRVRPLSSHQLQQLRWKRKDGNRFLFQEREPTAKQRKKYNRKIKAIEAKKGGLPGSKAGVRREWQAMEKQQWLDRQKGEDQDDELLDYDKHDFLLENIMTRSNDLLSQPTPLPEDLSRKFETYRQRVLQQPTDQLPSDNDVSLAIRSFRDRYGNRNKPVGLAKALEYVLRDLKVPLSAMDERSFSALLTTCRTPVEARRVLKLIKEQKKQISSYHWSIMVDIYSRIGDIDGCLAIHQEMLEHGVPPTLASFTSLLAACYRVASNGQLAREARARAGKIAWKQWQEMRVVGLVPDVMAYGAILRIMATQGYPERALNILEEMQYNNVKPTTLCFTSALRAVARSHSIAIRYEQGNSRKNRRREFLTMHHGKMARKIVTLAEQAEVEQDDGFIAALISCASSAGDLPTAKAIYLASNLKQSNLLQSISSERGELGFDDDKDGRSNYLTTGSPNDSSVLLKEYGPDSRPLSALLLACANAAASTGLGDIWQGRENNGFLCLNSLRLINARRSPSYTRNAIPGQGVTDNLQWDSEDAKYDIRGDKRSKGKFRIEYDDTGGATLDELDPDFLRFYEDSEGRLKGEYQQLTFDQIWELRHGKPDHDLDEASGTDSFASVPANYLDILPKEKRLIEDGTVPGPSLQFDYNTMRWIEVNTPEGDSDAKSTEQVDDPLAFGVGRTPTKTRSMEEARHENTSKLYFDLDSMSWKEVDSVEEKKATNLTSFEQSRLNQVSTMEISAPTFEDFFRELLLEVEASGEEMDPPTEEEARDLFLSLYGEFMADDEEDEFVSLDTSRSTSANQVSVSNRDSLDLVSVNNMYTVQSETPAKKSETQVSSEMIVSGDTRGVFTINQNADMNTNVISQELEEIRSILPYFSDRRLLRILKAFRESFTQPSILDLSLLVRETVPDFITNTWLKQASLLTGRYVVSEARQKNLFDIHTMNGYLELEASVGSINRTLELYEYEYRANGIAPNTYSDRLVVQMLLRNKRFRRALELKEKIQSSGRMLDLHSYGSLVDFCGKRGQIGSAISFLEECIRLHGSCPTENYIKHLRIYCREENINIRHLIGDDPIAWLKEGEANLKREMSKKGRRDVQFARNRLLKV